MPQEEGPPRHATYVWSCADDRLVAVVLGDTPEEAQANAALMVQVSRAIATGEQAKAHALPMPGDPIRILVDGPDDAGLQRGDVVTVVADPDERNGLKATDEVSVWVLDAEGTQWALNPATRGTAWVAIPKTVEALT